MSAVGLRRLGLGSEGAKRLRRVGLGALGGGPPPTPAPVIVSYVRTEYFSRRPAPARART